MTTLGGDIKLFTRPYGTESIGFADIDIISGASDVVRDTGLETALAISIFSNARADDDDPLPFDSDGQGGWFAEAITGASFGSKLWLLYRSNITAKTLSLATKYISEALDRHIVGENMAKEYTVSVTKDPDAINRVKISISIVALDDIDYLYEYYINWQSQTGRI